jgi:hypothetical protein
MLNKFKNNWTMFKGIFNDKNDINEKSVVGFAAFAVMVVFAVADLATGYFGKDLLINEFIYDSFVWIVLGSFGIAEVGKVFGSKPVAPAPPPPAEEEEEQGGKNININIDDW